MVVESEDEPERILLDTSIDKEDKFQKQRGTPLTLSLATHSR